MEGAILWQTTGELHNDRFPRNEHHCHPCALHIRVWMREEEHGQEHTAHTSARIGDAQATRVCPRCLRSNTRQNPTSPAVTLSRSGYTRQDCRTIAAY